jgi:hypothetical protein
MRYVCAVVLCACSGLFIAFAVSAGSLESLLLGLSGIAASAGMAVRHDEATRYLCAAVLLANALMLVQGWASSGSLVSLAFAAVSFAAASGLVLRQQWVRIPTVITSVMAVGAWAAAAFGAALEHRWPYADMGDGFISLMPGLLLSAIWIWCAFAVAGLCGVPFDHVSDAIGAPDRDAGANAERPRAEARE